MNIVYTSCKVKLIVPKRINLKHRLFYEVDEVGSRIKILRMWSYYGDN
ncbi:hypothetical protein [Candidatus Tisiphia endosymbiont of Oplodontha viridula]